MRDETRLHKAARAAETLEAFIDEIRKFPRWNLTDDQKQYTKRDLRIFYDAVHGGK